MEWEFGGESDDGSPDYSRIVGMDPFASWLLGSALVHFNRGESEFLIPFIVAVFDPEGLGTFNAMVRGQGKELRVFVPEMYRPEDMEPGDYFVAYAKKSFFNDLATVPDLAALRDAPKQIKLGLPLKAISLPRAWPVPVVPPPVPEVPDNTVVIGIIDDGIAFAHERFRTADGKTRVQYFWRMDGPLEENSTVSTGREIWKVDFGTRKGIDSLLSDFGAPGLVDEDQVYRAARFVDFRLEDHKAAAFNTAHGTLVLDLAAGSNPRQAPANKAIIAVQLPVAATADTSGAGLEVYVKQAVDYILDRADRLANGRQFPVVINFSYGTIAGPHDGTSAIEAAIDNCIASRPHLNVVLPAGNNHLSRCHAEIAFSKEEETTTLDWRVQPDDLTLTQMEIWMPYDTGMAPQSSRVTISITTPSGLVTGALGEIHGRAINIRDKGKIVAQARYSFVPQPTSRGMFAISILPTALLEPHEPGRVFDAVAPSGTWKVDVTNICLTRDQKVEAWIQRDDAIYGYPRRGRQSYFQAGCYTRLHPTTGDDVKWDHEENSENAKEGLAVGGCRVKRRGLINAIATGDRTTVVGGVYGKELQVVEYSAGGPITATRGGPVNRLGPDVLAVSDDSKVHRGVIAAGSRSGSAAVMNGTSVATPQITREVANLFATPTKHGDRGAIRQVANVEEAAFPNRPAKPADIRGGSGRIIRQRPDRPRRYDP